jgi:hypothetical protein
VNQGMEQEMPLTPAMIDYAQSASLRKGNVASMVVFAVLLTCAIPAFFSFTMFMQHRPLGVGAVIVWIVCIGLAIGLIYFEIRGAREVSRDLAGGVCMRWSGPYTTRVVRVGRYSKGLAVDAGGSRLYGVVPLGLLPTGFNSGTVDYLPRCKMLFEVRNEQGALLFSAFGTAGDSIAASPPQ